MPFQLFWVYLHFSLKTVSMIRNLLLSIFLFSAALASNAQAKKYIFLEHFTNTLCGVCGATNPRFYNLLKNYEDDYHHLSVHPSFPYSQCSLYQANKTENSARASYYNISSTPSVMINGTRRISAGSITATILDAELNKTSPIAIQVRESGGSMRNISVEVKTLGTKPGGNYRIYVAAAERILNFNAPNGEKVHQNVFRKFLSSVDGDMIQLAESGNSVNLTYNMVIEPYWKESEMYALVWIQDVSTKEVINSGNKFDEDISSTYQPRNVDFKVLTNPVKNNLLVQFEKVGNGEYAVLNIMGQVMERGAIASFTGQLDLDVSHYKKGIYLIRVQSGSQKLTKRWVKE